MDVIPLRRRSVPAMPPAVRVLVALAKYAAFGCFPMGDPERARGHSDPDRADPRHQGTDYAYLRSPTRWATSFIHRPGSRARRQQGVLGAGDRAGAPQPALNLALDGPHNNVKNLSFEFDKERKELPILLIRSRSARTDPIPIVGRHSTRRSARCRRCRQDHALKDTAKMNPLLAAMRRIAYAGKHSDSVFGTGTLDVARYGHVLPGSRQLVGVRGAGEAFDGLYYVTVGRARR